MKSFLPLIFVLVNFCQAAPSKEKAPIEFKLKDSVVLTIDSVQEVKLTRESDPPKWDVALTLLPADAAKFEKITQDHIQEELAVLVDGKVVLSPRIMAAISNGRILISEPSRKKANYLFQRLKKIEAAPTQN